MLGTVWFGILLVAFGVVTISLLTRPPAEWVTTAPECSPPPRWLAVVTGVLASSYLAEALLTATWPMRRSRRWAAATTAVLVAQFGAIATYPLTSQCFQVESQLYAIAVPAAVSAVPLTVAAWVSWGRASRGSDSLPPT